MSFKIKDILKINMGVDGLLKYIREKHQNSVMRIPVREFQGKRIAMDTSGFMCKLMFGARASALKTMDMEKTYDEQAVRKIWYTQMINLFCTMLDFGILPIPVFDGKAPDIKSNERAARVEKSRKKKEEIAIARKMLENCNTFDKPGMIENLRNAYKNDISILPADFELIKIVLAGTGLPCIQSVSECDHLISQLCLRGDVAAVFSIDSDILTHGTGLLITHILSEKEMKEHNLTEKTFMCYNLGYLLESMQMSFASFVDFCILCGVDYNRGNVKIKGLGPVKAEQLIKKYKYIEDIPKAELKKISKDGCIALDGYCHISARHEFSHFSLDELISEFTEKDDNDSDEEYLSDEEQEQEEVIAGLKIVKEKDEIDNKDVKRPNLFGNRRDRFQLVSNSDIRNVLALANVENLTEKMKSCIWRYLEKFDDMGSPGAPDSINVWHPKIHRWTTDGKLYIDGKLFEEF